MSDPEPSTTQEAPREAPPAPRYVLRFPLPTPASEGEYLLAVTLPSAGDLFALVDTVVSPAEWCVEALRGGRRIALFSKALPWAVIHRSLVEFLTKTEALEQAAASYRHELAVIRRRAVDDDEEEEDGSSRGMYL